MELWDIYNENKEKTGRTMKRNDWNMKPDEFHLTVLGVIKRPDGTYLITRRKLDKEWAAGWWEVPGGGVVAGESSADAVKREILEETGIDVTGADGGYAFSYKRVNPEEKNNYFVDVYKFTMDIDTSDVKLQEAETSGFSFATLSEISDYAKTVSKRFLTDLCFYQRSSKKATLLSYCFFFICYPSNFFHHPINKLVVYVECAHARIYCRCAKLFFDA